MEDEELVVRIKAGDEDAARELVERYYGAILRYCRWHCQGAERAEDLTQETFFKLFRNLPEYEERKKFRPYLYTIASRLCVDESRGSGSIPWRMRRAWEKRAGKSVRWKIGRNYPIFWKSFRPSLRR